MPWLEKIWACRFVECHIKHYISELIVTILQILEYSISSILHTAWLQTHTLQDTAAAEISQELSHRQVEGSVSTQPSASDSSVMSTQTVPHSKPSKVKRSVRSMIWGVYLPYSRGSRPSAYHSSPKDHCPQYTASLSRLL